MFAAVGVKVDDLTVRETNAEAFFYEHVAFFIISKSGLATTTRLCSRWLLKGALVVNELGGLGQVDGSTRLPCRLVVSGKLCTFQAEETASPVRTISTLLAQRAFEADVLDLLSFLELDRKSVV